MFGLYHLSKFYDLISPLFLSLWLLVVLCYYGIIAIFDCVDSKSRVTPTTSSDIDDVETVEDDDFCHLVDHNDNKEIEAWSKTMATNESMVHELLHIRDKLVTSEAHSAISQAIELGKESCVDRIIYPRYNPLGNVANPDHFNSFTDLSIFIRYLLYETLDNAVSCAEHPLRKQIQEFERLQREATANQISPNSSSSSSSSEDDRTSVSNLSPRTRNESEDTEGDFAVDEDADEDDYHEMYSNSIDEDDRSQDVSEDFSESDFYSDSMDRSFSDYSNSGSSDSSVSDSEGYESYGSQIEVEDDDDDHFQIKDDEEEEGEDEDLDEAGDEEEEGGEN